MRLPVYTQCRRCGSISINKHYRVYGVENGRKILTGKPRIKNETADAISWEMLFCIITPYKKQAQPRYLWVASLPFRLRALRPRLGTSSFPLWGLRASSLRLGASISSFLLLPFSLALALSFSLSEHSISQ